MQTQNAREGGFVWYDFPMFGLNVTDPEVVRTLLSPITILILLLPNIAAGVVLYFAYWEKLKTRNFSSIFIGFIIYIASYVPFALLTPILLAFIPGWDQGAGFLWIFYIWFAPWTVPIWYLLQLFVAHFLTKRPVVPASF